MKMVSRKPLWLIAIISKAAVFTWPAAGNPGCWDDEDCIDQIPDDLRDYDEDRMDRCCEGTCRMLCSNDVLTWLLLLGTFPCALCLFCSCLFIKIYKMTSDERNLDSQIKYSQLLANTSCPSSPSVVSLPHRWDSRATSYPRYHVTPSVTSLDSSVPGGNSFELKQKPLNFMIELEQQI